MESGSARGQPRGDGAGLRRLPALQTPAVPVPVPDIAAAAARATALMGSESGARGPLRGGGAGGRRLPARAWGRAPQPRDAPASLPLSPPVPRHPNPNRPSPLPLCRPLPPRTPAAPRAMPRPVVSFPMPNPNLLGNSGPTQLEFAEFAQPQPLPAMPSAPPARMMSSTSTKSRQGPRPPIQSNRSLPGEAQPPQLEIVKYAWDSGLVVGTTAVHDVDSRLPGEAQPPQPEVTHIAKYASDPGLVLGSQIAVNRTYLVYGNIHVLNRISNTLGSLIGHTEKVTDMAFFAEDVHLLASASVDGRIYVWRIHEGPDEQGKSQITGKIEIAIQIVGEAEAYHPRICWHSHKQEILYVGIGNCVLRIDTTKVGSRKDFVVEGPVKCHLQKLIDGIHLVGKHNGDVTTLSTMSTSLASGSKDGTVKIWDDCKQVPSSILKPHDGQAVYAVAFLTTPQRPNHINLITVGPLNREVKIWASSNKDGWLPSHSETWKCTQTLELVSSLEPRVEEAFFNQVAVMPQQSLILLANAKKRAIYAVHVEYGGDPDSTCLDCKADLSVAMPILSFAAAQPNGEQVVQVYCVGHTHEMADSCYVSALSKPPTTDLSAELDLEPSAPLTYTEGDGSMPLPSVPPAFHYTTNRSIECELETSNSDSCLVRTTTGQELNFADVKLLFLKWHENDERLLEKIRAIELNIDDVERYCRENVCLFVELNEDNKGSIQRTYENYKLKNKNADKTDGDIEVTKHQFQKKFKGGYRDMRSLQMREYRKNGGSKLRVLWRFFIKEKWKEHTSVNSQNKKSKIEERRKLTEQDVDELMKERENAIANLEQTKRKAKEKEEQLTSRVKELEYLLLQSNNNAKKKEEQLRSRVQELETAYNEAFVENQKLFNEVQELKGNIRVYCRVRPPGEGKNRIPIKIENNELKIPNTQLFKFNKVFDEFASQAEVYYSIQPLIRSVLDGFKVCIFAYGQTGSGKTYTMTGPKQDLGVNYRALNDLFDISLSRRNVFSYEVGVQMIEIYNEHVRDLLSSDRKTLQISTSSTSQLQGLVLPDATYHLVKSTSDILHLMEVGQTNRAVGSTALNERSSRSHSVLMIHVQGLNLKNGSTSRGSLQLIDLAGSECVGKSQVTGDRLKEAQYINKSLSALGDVIEALSKRNAHIPYRNSKLTYILRSSLGGNAKTLMFTHINLNVESQLETVNTLRFATRVSRVELGASISNEVSGETEYLSAETAESAEQLFC